MAKQSPIATKITPPEAPDVSPHFDDVAAPSSSNDQETIWMRYRFALLLAGSIVASLILTVISMTIYTQSGAAQLDLSRPGYRSVSDKVEKEDTVSTFSPTGSVDKDVIKDFINLYKTQADKTKAIDAFNGDPLNPEVLEFGSGTGGE